MDSRNTPTPHPHTRTIHTSTYPTRHSPPSCGHAWGHTLRRVSLLLRFVRVFDAARFERVFDTATGGSDTPSPPTFRTGVRRTGVRISDTSTVRTGVRIRYATYRIAVCVGVGWYVCSGDCVLPVFPIPCIRLLSNVCSLFGIRCWCVFPLVSVPALRNPWVHMFEHIPIPPMPQIGTHVRRIDHSINMCLICPICPSLSSSESMSDTSSERPFEGGQKGDTQGEIGRV